MLPTFLNEAVLRLESETEDPYIFLVKDQGKESQIYGAV